MGFAKGLWRSRGGSRAAPTVLVFGEGAEAVNLFLVLYARSLADAVLDESDGVVQLIVCDVGFQSRSVFNGLLSRTGVSSVATFGDGFGCSRGRESRTGFGGLQLVVTSLRHRRRFVGALLCYGIYVSTCF